MSFVIAHRGASAAERENTVVAFARAGEMGAAMVELDVRWTADRRLAVHHDARLADGRLVAATAQADLPDHIPDLATALAACAGMNVNVEIKNDPDEPDFDTTLRIADATVAEIARLGWRDRVLVSCFHLATLDRVRALDADLRTAWLVTWVTDPAATVATLVAHGHRVLHPFHLAVGPALMSACRTAGVAVNTWTVDDPERMRWLVAQGVEGICTNVPDVAVQALA